MQVALVSDGPHSGLLQAVVRWRADVTPATAPANHAAESAKLEIAKIKLEMENLRRPPVA
jgi:hypothetical protein